jgi:hypothetical protein
MARTPEEHQVGKRCLTFGSLICALVVSCAPATGPVVLGTESLTRPIDVADVDTYHNERSIGLVLVDAEGTEVLVSIVRTLEPTPTGMEAYRPLNVPCGTVFVGSLVPVDDSGQQIDRRDPGAKCLRSILGDYLKGEVSTEKAVRRDHHLQRRLELTREALAILDNGCAPSPSYVVLGDIRLLEPIQVEEAVTYWDGGTYGFRLLDAKGEQLLLSIDRRTRWDMTEEGVVEAYPIPYGTLLVGVMHPGDGEGMPVAPCGAEEVALGVFLRSWRDRGGVNGGPLSASEQDQMREQTVREAIEYLWSKCEPSN